MAAVWVSRSKRCIATSLASTTKIGAVLGRLLNASANYHSTASLNSSLPAGAGAGSREQKPELSGKSAAILSPRRFESVKAAQLAEAPCYSSEDDYDDRYDPNRTLDFPGGRVPFTAQMKFISAATDRRIPCYRVLDDDGYVLPGSSVFEQVRQEMAMKMYSAMVTVQTVDTIFYEAQRQGRLSFYLTSFGEEAVSIGSAAALSPDDVLMLQYRELGVLLWRDFSLQEMANQCFGNKGDYGKGRQMPIHYGSNKHNILTISSPLATQIPQAAGVAYSLKMDEKDACVVTYFGDGTTSEGDFHAGLNFAAVMEAPVVFICRNNGWAISTPVSEQFRSDGIVTKGQGYGITSIRVDGNDALAVYNAIRVAREMAIKQQKPILVEALTYRVSHHSTSDDSTKYRPTEEIEHWKTARSPVGRFRKWIQRHGWWSDEDEHQLRGNIRKQVLQAIQEAEKMEKPSLAELFSDVYDKVPSNLKEQERSLRDIVMRHPKDYPADVPV
ncbi:2-oxoisovalerate dehydrogenase subunit alpha 1, mitochondrial-like isoform X1 [Ipomoea triloba]|uniref:2-oxoisovalerate dehydrogenase subunit alpha 1, mitochondrial-like isoform X1 n=1 Tax=Ipomoea triloba TaxID=35885 RepID=UPI00125E11CE|nr:2-oxoisovalerate dehydrogenase subunit alpha 1, mitochondrial-like isoform X1 [Ipomoea triloba]